MSEYRRIRIIKKKKETSLKGFLNENTTQDSSNAFTHQPHESFVQSMPSICVPSAAITSSNRLLSRVPSRGHRQWLQEPVTKNICCFATARHLYDGQDYRRTYGQFFRNPFRTSTQHCLRMRSTPFSNNVQPFHTATQFLVGEKAVRNKRKTRELLAKFPRFKGHPEPRRRTKKFMASVAKANVLPYRRLIVDPRDATDMENTYRLLAENQFLIKLYKRRKLACRKIKKLDMVLDKKAINLKRHIKGGITQGNMANVAGLKVKLTKLLSLKINAKPSISWLSPSSTENEISEVSPQVEKETAPNLQFVSSNVQEQLENDTLVKEDYGVSPSKVSFLRIQIPSVTTKESRNSTTSNSVFPHIDTVLEHQKDGKQTSLEPRETYTEDSSDTQDTSLHSIVDSTLESKENMEDSRFSEETKAVSSTVTGNDASDQVIPEESFRLNRSEMSLREKLRSLKLQNSSSTSASQELVVVPLSNRDEPKVLQADISHVENTLPDTVASSNSVSADLQEVGHEDEHMEPLSSPESIPDMYSGPFFQDIGASPITSFTLNPIHIREEMKKRSPLNIRQRLKQLKHENVGTFENSMPIIDLCEKSEEQSAAESTEVDLSDYSDTDDPSDPFSNIGIARQSRVQPGALLEITYVLSEIILYLEEN